MSGMVGIVNFDGAPVDRALLSRMTASLDFRGPDARRVWIAESNNVGFGHTLLRTTYEAEHEQQPFTLDGDTWIVADCRVDAREELLAKLRAKGRDASLQRPDVELILHAWHVWGEECVEHLLGDFAFAIWDAPRRQLFCARDHMGVKPFHYANIASTLIFSNTLDCVRMHPAVSDELNDLAIADFLLFEINQGKDTTSFADIQRIPPAYSATWNSVRVKLQRYWTLPIDEPIYFKRFDDYTDRFTDLLHVSVSDRLRTKKVGIFMSGGLDSATLAATAKQVLSHHHPNYELRAFTTVFDGVIDNSEEHHAQLVARYLEIPIEFQRPYEEMANSSWDEAPIHSAEPYANPIQLASDRSHSQTVSARTRVVLYGEGPDNALNYEWRPYLSYLADRRRFGRLLYDVASLMVRHRRIPFISTIPKMIRERGLDWTQHYPLWLNPEFEERFKLRDRWESKQSPQLESRPHPVRPAAYQSFTGNLWSPLLEGQDPGNTNAPLEVRHPYFDLRVLRYLMAVPAVPWCRNKHLIRSAMRGALPPPILRRGKAPLNQDPNWLISESVGLPPLQAIPSLRRYITAGRVPATPGEDMVAFRRDLRARGLAYWLRSGESVRNNHYNSLEVFANGTATEIIR